MLFSASFHILHLHCRKAEREHALLWHLRGNFLRAWHRLSISRTVGNRVIWLWRESMWCCLVTCIRAPPSCVTVLHNNGFLGRYEPVLYHHGFLGALSYITLAHFNLHGQYIHKSSTRVSHASIEQAIWPILCLHNGLHSHSLTMIVETSIIILNQFKSNQACQ